MEKTSAPWDDEQIRSLNTYQQSGVWHPFTCGTGHHEDGEVLLVASPSGWMCERDDCDYEQYWAWAWMADWSWRKIER